MAEQLVLRVQAAMVQAKSLGCFFMMPGTSMR